MAQKRKIFRKKKNRTESGRMDWENWVYWHLVQNIIHSLVPFSELEVDIREIMFNIWWTRTKSKLKKTKQNKTKQTKNDAIFCILHISDAILWELVQGWMEIYHRDEIKDIEGHRRKRVINFVLKGFKDWYAGAGNGVALPQVKLEEENEMKVYGAFLGRHIHRYTHTRKKEEKRHWGTDTPLSPHQYFGKRSSSRIIGGKKDKLLTQFYKTKQKKKRFKRKKWSK